MKYQSEIVNEILEKRGHGKSSLHYQSECIKAWIEESRPSYPKLCDYEGEWLNYINKHETIGEFPYISLTDVTEATVNNVVPYEYKSAILKGNTERIPVGKNIFDKTSKLYDGWLYANGNYCEEIGGKFYTTDFIKVKPNTDIVVNNGSGYALYDDNKKCVCNVTYGSTTTLSNTKYIRVVVKKEVIDTLQIEYGTVPTDYEEPKCELQSVKMPVLTTTGKNIIDGQFKPGTTNLNITTFPWFKDGAIGSSTRAYLDKPSNIISGKTYTVSCINSGYVFAVQGKNLGTTDKFDSGWKINAPYTFTATYECYALYVRKSDDSTITTQDELEEMYNSIMVEEGSVATSYEPYKTNILTVNEDVTLRSNGDVYDELNLLTGRLTQRIDEDGSVLTQEVVKTVDLNVEDQDGNTLSKIKPIEGTMHISTDGNPIKPTFTGEVPIEAITQNLASFIEE